MLDRRRVRSYLAPVVAVLAALAAAFVHYELDTIWGSKLPFITFYPAVALAAWFGGLWPGLLATAVSAVCALLFLPPLGSLWVDDPSDFIGLALFTSVNVFITVLSNARNAAEAASRAKDTFLAMVAHELRTLLSTVVAWTRMLRKGDPGLEEVAHGLDVIERCARSQAHLIEDLLDVSRIVAGKMRLEVRPVMVAPVIEKAVDIVRLAADAKGVRLRTVLDPEVGAVLGDAERLQQVVWNLLSNAVKFTPEGGRVQVALERSGGQARIVVSDTGQGIRSDFLPYAFDAFRHSDGGTASKRHGGLGLGLAIVRRLVELHGGRVEVSSQGEGRGATFTVTLPLAPLTPHDSMLTTRADLPPHGTPS